MADRKHDNFYSMGQTVETGQDREKIAAVTKSTAPADINTKPAKKSRQQLRKERYDKYLVGRSYQLFKRGIKTKMTLVFYDRMLYKFCAHLDMTTDEIVEKYGPYIKVKGKNQANIEGQMELQKRLEDYVLSLQEKVEAGEIEATTCVSHMPPLRLFFEMNDVLLNFKKINRLLPSSDLSAADEAYTREQIKKMLEHCDLRTKIIVLFLASSGMRLGGLTGLKDGDLRPMYDKDDPSKVVAAHVIVYAGTDDAYDTFVSVEAWQAYVEYRSVRTKYGEVITKDSPVITARFNYRKTIVCDKVKAMDRGTICNVIGKARRKAGVLEVSKEYNNRRYTVKGLHGFRKFFSSTVSSIKTADGLAAIRHTSKEKLLGHTLVGDYSLENHYDRRKDIIDELLQEYLRAAPELTISDKARLAHQVTKLEKDVSEYKTIEVEVAQKDKEIRQLRAQVEKVQAESDMKYKHIISLIQQNPKLANVKPEELERLEVHQEE
jgi:integrase